MIFGAVIAGLCLGVGAAPAVPAAPAASAASAARSDEAVPPDSPWNHDWARGAVFYEIFVRSFADSDGDGIGDLNGLISKLDYLNDGDSTTIQDLGVDAIWLMPVFRSPSYHGYDTTDYEHINPDYGTDADFARLLDEAHRRGIRVIVDLVLNHTSSEHPWFRESASSPSSPRRNWYVWSMTDRGWGQPWNPKGDTWHPLHGAYYYGLFWEGMPDLNFRNPEVRKEMERIAWLWLARGIDGFRLDATRHLIETGAGKGQNDTPETHAFLKEFAAYVRSVKPGAVLVGENWTDTETIARYFGSTSRVSGGDELPMNFDFPLAESIVGGVKSEDASRIAATLSRVRAHYPQGATDAPFLANHDQVRLATQLGGEGGRLRCAAAILLTLPGAPFLYYGEEVGLENGPERGDEAKRTPMPWNASPVGGFTAGVPWHPFAPGRDRANVAAEMGDSTSLLWRYRELIRVRKGSSALRGGGIEMLAATAEGSPILAYVRDDGAERVLVAHNLSDRPERGGPFAIAARSFERLFADEGVGNPAGESGAIEVTLPAHAAGIWRLR